MRTEKLTMGSA